MRASVRVRDAFLSVIAPQIHADERGYSLFNCRNLGLRTPRALQGDLTRKIIGVFFDVYNELGPASLESVYQSAMALALEDSSLRCEREKSIEVTFGDRVVGTFRADLVVEGMILLELKAARSIDDAFGKQLLGYHVDPRRKSPRPGRSELLPSYGC